MIIGSSRPQFVAMNLQILFTYYLQIVTKIYLMVHWCSIWLLVDPPITMGRNKEDKVQEI